MVIPWVKIVWISDLKGYGLVASRSIPKGTITFAQDGMDIVIPGDKLADIDPLLKDYVEKYSYEDYLGNRIVSWDLGKYMNHDNKANTLSTGYGFEIAIRDIEEGEEVTDDYRIFSAHHDDSFQNLNDVQNLAAIKPWPDDLIEQWDSSIKQALQHIEDVEQPLHGFVNPKLWSEIKIYNKENGPYRSVSEALPLRYKLQTEGLHLKRKV